MLMERGGPPCILYQAEERPRQQSWGTGVTCEYCLLSKLTGKWTHLVPCLSPFLSWPLLCHRFKKLFSSMSWCSYFPSQFESLDLLCPEESTEPIYFRIHVRISLFFRRDKNRNEILNNIVNIYWAPSLYEGLVQTLSRASPLILMLFLGDR